MDDVKRMLQGSKSRDLFKFRHKLLDESLHATDIDFMLVCKDPEPGIVAVLDYKTHGDKIRFSEVLAYNFFKVNGVLVFIVQGSSDPDGKFTIFEYESGDHRPEPPDCNLREVCKTESWEDFEKWELRLRGEYRKAIYRRRGTM